MDNHIFDKTSMKKRLRKAVLIVLFIQGLFLVVSIFGGGTIQQLSNEYEKIFNDHVIGRKSNIEKVMTQQWSNMTELEAYVQEQVGNVDFDKSPYSMPRLLEHIAPRTVLFLRQRGVTGVFVMLDTEGTQEGIYIRDLDPLLNPSDNSDLIMEKGPLGAARTINASLGNGWSRKFELLEGDDNSDFYYKPFLAAQENPDMSYNDLGYWSKPFALTPEELEVITYSIPLMDRNGSPYGVIGVEITLDYLRNYLPYDELARKKQGAYFLGIEPKEEGIFEKVVSAGPIFRNLVESESELAFAKELEDQEVYIMKKNKKKDTEIYKAIQYMNLYNTNTPFEDDKWALIGLIEKKVLLQPIIKIIITIGISILISLCLGMITVYAVMTWFMKPITKLIETVLRSDPNNPIILRKTNITEIDELAGAIETLSREVADSSSKLAQIISMVNVPIGAFEHNHKENQVFFTETLYDILEIEKNEQETNYIATHIFNQVIGNIMEKIEPDLEDIYRYERTDGTIRWVRMQIQETKGKTLGVIEDVTEDVIAKRKLEYERDHDVLTHLLNRRAFHVRVRKKMQDLDIDQAAFIMWDLDNLKYVNDTYGHDYGDQYIKQAASILNKVTIDNAIVGRISGDEFYTFIYGYKTKEEIRKRVWDMKNMLNETLLTMPDGTTLRLRASAGMAWYPDDSRNYEELIKYSDFAMYTIKNTDKGNIGEFNRKGYERDSILLDGREELNRFIDDELVKFVFQPIVDARTGEVFAYEALMRPQVETLKSPLDIIRLAHSQSKLADIERITWFNAMEGFIDNQEAFGNAKVFINSIPNHRLSDADLEKFETKYQKHLSRIVVEIIENEQSNEECTKVKQEAVARWGSHLALDDFGSGYNNETTLLILSPKFIKIDMAIIRGIDRDFNRQKLVRNILSYAQNRNTKIIAEGIETKDEMEKLIEIGVDYMQGYYLGMPHMTPQSIAEDIVDQIKQR